jgi:hypothetical protein
LGRAPYRSGPRRAYRAAEGGRYRTAQEAKKDLPWLNGPARDVQGKLDRSPSSTGSAGDPAPTEPFPVYGAHSDHSGHRRRAGTRLIFVDRNSDLRGRRPCTPQVPRVGIRPRSRNPERVDSDLQRPNQSLPHRRTEPESTVSPLQAETSRKAETNRTADTSHTVETKGEGKKRLVGSGVMGTQEDEQRPTSKATVSGELGEQERQLALVIQQTRRPIPTLSPEVSR